MGWVIDMTYIQMQLSGLIFDLILCFFIARHESVGIYSEKLFKQCVIVYTSCVVLDILSCIAIIHSAALPEAVVLSACKAYLINLEVSGYFGFAYAYNDIKHLRDSSIFKNGIMLTALFGALIIAVLPVNYHFGDGKLYSYGPAVIATYVLAPTFIISSLIVTFTYGKQMNIHRRNAVRTWMIIEIVAALIQFIMPEMLLVGFGSSIGLFILYSELENPEVYLDRDTGCFSFNTFNIYLNQEFEEVKPFSAIIICNDNEWKLSDESEKRVLVEMSEFLNSFGDSKLFRLPGHDFALIYDKNEKEMNEIESAVNLDVIRQRFDSEWRYIKHASFLYVPNGHIASSMEEFIQIYQRYRYNQGEDNTRILDDESAKLIREFNGMIIEINDALNEDRIEVFYQPIYSLSTGKFVSAEALARLVSRDGKVIMPGRFIPVAEETGLIEQIGERVFEKTCKCIRDNHLKDKGVEYIEVNLSVAQCENPMLSTTYQEIMKHSDVKPAEINLEITESSTLNQRNILLANMNELMRYGCSFSLDDFGTGESNLNYIVDMPVKIVKFDRSMVQDYFSNERARVVMTAAVNMIKELGLKIVAEGVETEEQVQGIRELGIDYIQGFYFSKPLPQKEFISFIQEKNL